MMTNLCAKHPSPRRLSLKKVLHKKQHPPKQYTNATTQTATEEQEEVEEVLEHESPLAHGSDQDQDQEQGEERRRGRRSEFRMVCKVVCRPFILQWFAANRGLRCGSGCGCCMAV
jgi:hypothetical protein